MNEQIFSKFTINKYDGLDILLTSILFNFEGVLDLQNRSMTLEFDNKNDLELFINDVKKENSGWTLMKNGSCYTPNGILINFIKNMKTVEDFINYGENEFINIDSEVYREYVFQVPNSPFTNTIRINNPLKLCVKSNGHRVWDTNNESHYIPSGWIHLKWKVKDGQPNFVK